MKTILLGSYTRRVSEGIYQITLNTQTHQLEGLKLVAKTQNPTYLDFDPKTQTLYAVCQEGDQGGIASWHLENDTAQFEYSRVQKGPQPCYVRYHEAEAFIYEANYHNGSINVTQDQKTYKEIRYPEGSHAHYIDYDPKTNDVFVCDLGLDTIHKYRLMNEIATYKTSQGTGPRHLVFHPTLPIFYAFGELSNTIEVLEDDDFDIHHKQTVSTLPSDFQGKSAGAAIRISHDGRFLYASNRGHDSIAIFSVNPKGNLALIDTISTEGEHPRDFILAHDDQYLIVANMTSDTLTLFARDFHTGRLSLLQKDCFAPECVALKVIDSVQKKSSKL